MEKNTEKKGKGCCRPKGTETKDACKKDAPKTDKK